MFQHFRRGVSAGLLVGLSASLMACQTEVAPSWSVERPGSDRDLTHLLLTWQEDPTTTMTIQWLEQTERLPLSAGQVEAEPKPQVPAVGEVQLNVEQPEWLDRALHLAFLAEETHRLPEPSDFSATGHLAWNEDGLLLYLDVQDDHFIEHEQASRLWDGDGVEVFVSDGIGSEHRYQLLLAPGTDASQDGPRHHFYDTRDESLADAELEVTYQVQVDQAGYRLEALLPWTNLGMTPERGRELAFQFYLNDQDDPEGGVHQRLLWYPRHGASRDLSAMKTIVLADEASAPVRGRLVVDEQGTAHIYATPDLIGQRVRVTATDIPVGRARFEAYEHQARATIDLDQPPRGHRWGTLHAWADGQHLASYTLAPDVGPFETPAPVEVVYHRFDSEGQDAQRVQTEPTLIRQWPGHHRHRVTLTGLDPDTAYQFHVPGYHRPLAFYTMPETLSRPIRIAVGGDTRHRKEWMVRTNQVAMAHNPDFIVWGGDMAYADARQNQLYRWQEWFEANYETLIDDDGFVTPIIVAIGNHEVRNGYYFRHDWFEPTDKDRQRLAPYFYQLFAFPGQPGYDVLDFGEYLSLVILDSDHTNPVEGEQTQWLERVLHDRQHVPHVIPVYHVPAYPSHRDFEGRTAQAVRKHWTPLFDAYNIRVAFENHDHTYKRTPPIRDNQIDPEGVVYIGDGAWGVGVREVHDPAQTWYLERAESVRHAIIVTLEANRQLHRVYSEDGELIDEYVDDR